MKRSTSGCGLLAVLLLGCAAKPGPAPSPGDPHASCSFDPFGDVDCERACASFGRGHEANTARGVFGEFVSPQACPQMCAGFNDPEHHAEPDTVIQWNCLAEHDMCSSENTACQRGCLDAAHEDRDPAQFALCGPPGDVAPGA